VTPADNQHERSRSSTEPPEQAWEPQGPAAPGRPDPAAADQATAAPDGAEAGAGDRAPEAPADRDLADETPTDLVADLAAAKQSLAERTADLQRLQAEYLNYKRRVDRDRELVKENATSTVLLGLLPVLDDIDRAREHGEVEGGFKAVADSLDRIVTGLGLVKYGEPGDVFDPNLHEALMHAHSPDVTTTTCQNIVHAGYRIGDRVVRPARVTVVDPEPTSDGERE
jgi:molecular chaperone GrpE